MSPHCITAHTHTHTTTKTTLNQIRRNISFDYDQESMVSKSQQHHQQQQQLQQTATTGEYLTMILLLNYYVFPRLFSMMNFHVVVIHLGSHTDTHTHSSACKGNL